MEIAQRNDQLGIFTDVSEIPLYGMMKVPTAHLVIEHDVICV